MLSNSVSMPKLLIISGPTATGKTALAIKLAKKFNGELISADSRQIYQGLDIGTGKDHPTNIKIHLIDIIKPSEAFSVAQYQRLVEPIIRSIHQNGKLPILVGGSGQYINAIINPQETFSIKPNNFLRFFLNKFSLKTLQFTLKTLDFKTFNSLNNSDINNPHRLIRKIEIKLYSSKIKTTLSPHYQFLHLSLTASNQVLFSKINQRVKNRLDSGLFTEIKNLLKKYRWSDPGLNTLAYKEFKTGFNQSNIAQWITDEHNYARRQKTYLRLLKPTYFEITNPDYPTNLMALVAKWYNSS